MEGEINATNLCVIHLSSVIGGRRKPHGSEVKNAPNNAGDTFDPWVEKIPWRRKEQPTTIFLPGKPHGQRSLAGYSSWGHRESEETQRLNNNIVGRCFQKWKMKAGDLDSGHFLGTESFPMDYFEQDIPGWELLIATAIITTLHIYVFIRHGFLENVIKLYRTRII